MQWTLFSSYSKIFIFFLHSTFSSEKRTVSSYKEFLLWDLLGFATLLEILSGPAQNNFSIHVFQCTKNKNRTQS